jgi:hypothetical protein
LGDGQPNELVAGSFEIGNVGNGALQFTLVPGCGCSFVEPPTGVIAPGKRLTINAGIWLPPRHRREKHVSVRVHTSDPLNRVGTVGISAGCPSPYVVTPGEVDFGTAAPGTSPTELLQVRPRSEPAQNCRVRLSHRDFEITRQCWANDQLRLEIQLRPDAGLGLHVAELELQPGDGPAQRVPVRAFVAELLTCAPSVVHFERFATHEKCTRQLYIWRRDGQLLGSVVSLSSPPGLTVQECDSAVPGRRRFELTLNWQQLDQEAKQEFEFQFERDGMKAVIPFIVQERRF